MTTPSSRVAIALVHLYDKTSFLTKLERLDAVSASLPVTFFIYDAPHAASQRLAQSDLQQWRTPIDVVSGESTSRAVAYNALFRSISADHVWTMILEHSVLRDTWWSLLHPYFDQATVGLWGG